jgi:phage gpG-like protein
MLKDKSYLGKMCTIDYQVLGKTAVEIGSPMAYSKVQQFGGLSFWEEYGEWWRVPPRNFVGMSLADVAHIFELHRRRARRALQG